MNGAPGRSRQESLKWLRDNPRVVEPGQKVTVDFFRPEDAEGVARLVHAVYGEIHPVDYLYDPAGIIAANEGPDLHQVVARTASGDVVGLSALFRSAPGPGILENGSMMVLPAYRLARTIYELSRLAVVVLPERLGLRAVFGQCVCDHLVAQKLGDRFGFGSYALELEAMPARPGGEGGRLSLLGQFLIRQDVPQRLHAPPVYADFLRGLYGAHGLARDFAAGGALAGETRWETHEHVEASLAGVTADALGRDFAAVLDGLEADYPGRRVRQLRLPLTDPGLPEAVEAARGRGYFLGGVQPLWTGQDMLLMQKLAVAPDFAAPQLYDDTAKALLERIRQDHAAVS